MAHLHSVIAIFRLRQSMLFRRRRYLLILSGGSGNVPSVPSVNLAPTLSASAMTFNEDTPTTVTLGYSDPESDAANWATLQEVNNAGNLTLALNTPGNGQIRVTPAANWFGASSFEVRVQDAEGNWSNTLNIAVTVTSVNDAPTLANGSLSTNEDTAQDINLIPLYSDIETDSPDWATLEATVSPGKGTLQLNTPSNGSIRYTPSLNQTGADTFSVRVKDANGTWSTIAEISVTITAVNDVPVLSAGGTTINEDNNAVITLSATDVDGTINWSSLRVVTPPAHGSVQLNTPAAGQVTYSPAANNNADVTFTLAVSDNLGAESAAATMTVTINAVVDVPILTTPVSISTDEDTAVIFDVDSIWQHPDDTARRTTAGSIVCSTPTKGVLTINQVTGAITYTPNANENGIDSFTVQAYDELDAQSNIATVNVTIGAVDDAPAAYLFATDTFENNAVVIDLANQAVVADVENTTPDWSTLEVVTPPAHGTAVAAVDGKITYTPAQNNKTAVTFTWRVRVGGVFTPSSVIKVNILDTWIVKNITDRSPSVLYRFKEASGTFPDSSANARAAATVTNGSGTLSYANELLPDNSPAPRITAADQFINVGTDNNVLSVIGNSNTWSILMWFRSKGFNWNDGLGRFILQYFESNNQIYWSTFNTNQTLFAKTGGVTKSNTVPVIANGDTWHKLMVVFDQAVTATVKFFLDGVLLWTGTSVAAPNDASATSFRVGNNNQSLLNGLAANLTVYPTALPDATAIELTGSDAAYKYKHQTMRQIFNDKGCMFGVAIPNSWDSQPANVKALAAAEASAVICENAVKYSTLYQNGINSPSWSSFDQFVNAAYAANIPTIFHVLFWAGDDGVIQSAIANTREAALAEMDRRCAALKARLEFLGRPDPVSMDVINELMTDDDTGNIKTSFWWSRKFNNSATTGTVASTKDFIVQALLIANKHFPKTKLAIADFNVEKAGPSSNKGDAWYNLIAELRADTRLIVGGVHILKAAHMQCHFKANATYWFSEKIVEQIDRIKALGMEVAFTEMDVRNSKASATTTGFALASSTGTTLNVDHDWFSADGREAGWTINNLTNGETRKIATVVSGTQVTLTTAIGDAWDGHELALYASVDATVSASSTGSTLVTTAASFNAGMVGMCVWNKTNNAHAVITGYTNSTTVTLDRAIGDAWDGHSINIGTDAHWFALMKQCVSKLYYAGIWGVHDTTSWLGRKNSALLWDVNLAKKSAWYATALGASLAS